MRSVAEMTADVKAEILADIAEEVVPSSVRTFSELHDYVDANTYGMTPEGHFVQPDEVDTVLWEQISDLVGQVQNVVDQWLRLGRPADDARWLTLGELRRATGHLPDDTPITAATPDGGNWLNLGLDLSGIPKGQFCRQCGKQVRWQQGSGWIAMDDQAYACNGSLPYHTPVANDDPPSIILDTLDTFDTRQW